MTDWQIGEHGGSLVSLRNPADSQPVLINTGSTHTSLDGSMTLDIPGVLWQTTWTWQAIDDADYADIAAWVPGIGSHGNGPFDVIDPTIDTNTHLMMVDPAQFQPNPGPYFGLWSPVMVLIEVEPPS